jgi:hypothetical protein
MALTAKELLQPQNFRNPRITFESWEPYDLSKPNSEAGQVGSSKG